VASRRFSSALPAIRKATATWAAASDFAGKLRALGNFGTEIEAYDKSNRSLNDGSPAGQEIILYCEIEKLRLDPVDGVSKTKFARQLRLAPFGSAAAVSSQSLPEDHQVFRKPGCGDYSSITKCICPMKSNRGKYQIALTMEDICHGKSTANPPSIRNQTLNA